MDGRGSLPGSVARRLSARAAVRAERRRIARDLHDGIAQELAFIALHAREIDAHVAAAADRALAEVRRTIDDLGDDCDEPVGSALARTAEEIAGRNGARLVTQMDSDAQASPAAKAALVRILREAIWNGVRHGRATSFEVELCGREGLRMRVADNGRGFDPLVIRRAGFGLASMKERARALGGEIGIRSLPGRGCELEVRLP
jgi:signal transduction histidine kinase